MNVLEFVTHCEFENEENISRITWKTIYIFFLRKTEKFPNCNISNEFKKSAYLLLHRNGIVFQQIHKLVNRLQRSTVPLLLYGGEQRVHSTVNNTKILINKIPANINYVILY